MKYSGSYQPEGPGLDVTNPPRGGLEVPKRAKDIDITPCFTRNHIAIRAPDGAITLLEISDAQRELIDWVLFGLPDSGIKTEDQLLQVLIRMGIKKGKGNVQPNAGDD